MLTIEEAVETARRVAEAGARTALEYFRTDFTVERKADRSPVTVADRAAEAAMLEVIRQVTPEAAILTEESGALPGVSGERWIVDPIDGTRGFTRGGEYWGPLVALEQDARIVAGAMALPVLEKVYWAGRGLGCHRDGVRLQVSTVERIDDAIISLGELPAVLGRPHGQGVRELIDRAFSARCYGDLAGCALLLEGRADIWFEAGCRIWDLAPAQILIDEAGGRFTDFAGVATPATGNAVGTNGRLHDVALAAVA